MKVVNKTHFRTDDLRRILSRCAERELDAAKRKVLHVTVCYARRRGTASGCAHIGGRYATVRINKHEPNAAAFAWVAMHEFRHIRGWSHREMKATYCDADTLPYAWANELGIRRAEPKRKERPGVDAKLAHAERMHRQALTRQKRATTIARKWAAKIRYYSKKADTLPRAAVVHSISKSDTGG